jgi:hypothetical protein
VFVSATKVVSLSPSPSPASAQRFKLTISLSVADAARLWSAAAERGLAAPGATLDDVLDVIGPREDPAIAECLAMLAAPAAVAGCLLDGFDVSDLAASSRTESVQAAPRRRGRPRRAVPGAEVAPTALAAAI